MPPDTQFPIANRACIRWIGSGGRRERLLTLISLREIQCPIKPRPRQLLAIRSFVSASSEAAVIPPGPGRALFRRGAAPPPPWPPLGDTIPIEPISCTLAAFIPFFWGSHHPHPGDPRARQRSSTRLRGLGRHATPPYNPLGGSTPPYRLRGLGRHASRLCRPGHHRGYEVSVTRVAND
jgi:hypothetical protein